MTSIKEQMDRAFKIRNDTVSENRLALAIAEELKKVDVMRELRELGQAYRDGHISDKIAKETIEMMLSFATSEQLEGVYLRIIWQNQTKDERKSGATGHSNKIGLNIIDAPFISSLVKQIENGHSLSVKQVEALKKALRKYWKQMLEIY